MNYYTFYDNACRLYYAQEPPLEPPDCWGEDAPEPDDPEYDRAEDEMNDIFNR